MANKRRRRRTVRTSRSSGALIGFCIASSVWLMTMTALRAGRARADGPRVYAITGAQIVTGTGRTIAKGTVVFRDGLITEVGESVQVPADARKIDGSGLIVYPGLIDAFTNLGLPTQAGPQPAPGGGRQAALAAAQAATPQPEQTTGDPTVAAADQVKPGGAAFEDARAVGVTAALTSPRQGIFAGQSALINLDGEEPSKLIVRAPVALTVQFSAGAGFFGVYPNSLMGTVAFIRQTFYDAIHYRDEQERYSRARRGVPRPEYDKKLAALQPAIRGELPVLFIANSDGDIRRALMIAGEFKLRPMISGALYAYRVAGMLKARGVPVVLSVDFPKRPADLPDDVDEPLRVLRERAETPKGAAALAKAGVKFAFTSGSLKPQDFIANVKKAVDNGLTKEEALSALTSNAAEILGASEQLGTIEVGKIANLVVASGDLLGKDTKIQHVFIDGNEIELKKPEAAPRPGGPNGSRTGAQPAVDPSGEWKLTIHSPHGDLDTSLSLRRDGDDITGTFQGPTQTVDVRNATLDGNHLRFTVNVTLGADQMEATVIATIEGDSMHGSITVSGLGSFDFTGERPR